MRCPKCGTRMTLIKQPQGTPASYWKCGRCGKVLTSKLQVLGE